MTRAVVSLEESPVPAASGDEDGTTAAAEEEAKSSRSESLSPPRSPTPDDSAPIGCSGTGMLKKERGELKRDHYLFRLSVPNLTSLHRLRT